MQSEYRAFWKNKMWEVMQIDYRTPQTVILTDGETDHINVPIEDVVLMKNTRNQDISEEFVYISTNQSAITVEQMIEILSQQDKKALIYILDDNDKQRPVYDIGKEEDKIVICDF